MKNGVKIISAIIVTFTIFPIRMYLIWYTLKAVDAGELPMFLFWISVPLGIIVHLIGEYLKD